MLKKLFPDIPTYVELLRRLHARELVVTGAVKCVPTTSDEDVKVPSKESDMLESLRDLRHTLRQQMLSTQCPTDENCDADGYGHGLIDEHLSRFSTQCHWRIDEDIVALLKRDMANDHPVDESFFCVVDGTTA